MPYEFTKRPTAERDPEVAAGIGKNTVPTPLSSPPETKDVLGRAKPPEAPKGEVKARHGQKVSGMGVGEKGAKVRDAAEQAFEQPMKHGHELDMDDKLDVEERLELIEAELTATSMGYNSRVNSAVTAKKLKADEKKKKSEKKAA